MILKEAITEHIWRFWGCSFEDSAPVGGELKQVIEDKYINLILVLLTGRVWAENGGSGQIDLWSEPACVAFFIDHFLPVFLPKEFRFISTEPINHLPAQFGMGLLFRKKK